MRTISNVVFLHHIPSNTYLISLTIYLCLTHLILLTSGRLLLDLWSFSDWKLDPHSEQYNLIICLYSTLKPIGLIYIHHFHKDLDHNAYKFDSSEGLVE